MTVIELRDKLNKLIKEGKGDNRVAVWTTTSDYSEDLALVDSDAFRNTILLEGD